ncbi:hypothetical protein Tco_0525527 [Tanacetum coccineum]
MPGWIGLGLIESDRMVKRWRVVNQSNAKCKSEKFPPPHRDATVGHPLDPSQNGGPVSFSAGDDNSFGSSIFDSKSSRSVNKTGTVGEPSRRKHRKERSQTISSSSNSVDRHVDWDYRWMEYSSHLRHKRHPNDQSVSTYKGHRVLRTLIRCYFSLSYSTRQKYIYTRSADANIYLGYFLSFTWLAQDYVLSHGDFQERGCHIYSNYRVEFCKSEMNVQCVQCSHNSSICELALPSKRPKKQDVPKRVRLRESIRQK